MYEQFTTDIHLMNQRYKLEAVAGLIAICSRLPQFKDILDKEFTELEDIESELEKRLNSEQTQDMNEVAMMVRVSMADLLGDIVVYCASEAARWNIPLDHVLEIIMASNTSKLGADGQPIINQSNGKFEKGPNYWKPEPAIEHVLRYGENSFLINEDAGGVRSVTLLGPEE